MAKALGRKKVFPNPNKCKPIEQAVMCPADRALALYNQDSGDDAQRIAPKVQKWFKGVATSKGWAGVRFIKDVQSAHGSGCILWIPPRQVNVSVVIVNQLVLNPE